jgi:hypothetical protein
MDKVIIDEFLSALSSAEQAMHADFVDTSY